MDVVLMVLTYTKPGVVPDIVALVDRIELKSAVPLDNPLEVGIAVNAPLPVQLSVPYQTPMLAGCVGAPLAAWALSLLPKYTLGCPMRSVNLAEVATVARAAPLTVTGDDKAAPPERVAKPVTVAAALTLT